jgi:hypothetical protein
MFIDFSLLNQIQSFDDQGHLLQLMEQFAAFHETEYRGKAYEEVVTKGHIPVLISSDDAPVTKTRPNTVYPIVCYPLNIPPPFRHKFPFFLNLYAGKKTKKVSVGLLHSEALKSIKQYNEAPVVW